VAGLAPTFGRGAMTNHWADIKNADVVLVMGGNPAEAHPCGFKWVIEAKVKNKARLIVVDPRFTRTAAVADQFAQIRPGTDIAFLGGLIRHLLENDAIQHEYVKAYTNAPFLLREDYGFEDGLFTGYDEAKRSYDKTSWAYDLDKDGFAKVDPTLQDPRCVFQAMKRHYARYTPELVSSVTGVPAATFTAICRTIATTSAPNRTMTSLYALGWTQHSVGSQNIRAIAIVQLLLGNMGMAGGGVNALRGHSNIQGLTDLGVMSHLLPGYLTLPTEKDPDLKTYLEKRTPKALRPGQMNYWQNYPRFFVSLLKAWYGAEAQKENDFRYDWLPKNDRTYDVLAAIDLMHQGKITGYVCQGFNPLGSTPDKAKLTAALSKLKYLVTIDPLTTETSTFWKNHGEFHDVDPAAIQTEVFRLPSTCFAEEDGSLVNSGRWLQWHWKACDPPGEARGDPEIVAAIFLAVRDLYRKEGGAFPDPIVKLPWPYKIAHAPAPEELAREFNGVALADVTDPKDKTKVLAREGEQLATFAHLRDDGTTSAGCWIFTGSWTQNGNQMARRDAFDPSGLGNTPGWAWAWPANRRILYNRASADPAGKPWDPNRKLIGWNGKAWGGVDVPDYRVDAAPDEGVSPFIMNAEGVGKLFALGGMVEGPFPEHYEPFESPLGSNPLSPRSGTKTLANPAARIFKGDREKLGTAKDFPFVATTYRLTEHFHFWTKHTRIAAVLQPEAFIEIGEGLATLRGIRNGERVVIRSRRGEIKAKAMVTKRIQPLTIAGQVVHTVGLPIHWGFEGLTRPAYLVNTLTPFVGDANIQTPEFKAFLVDVQKLDVRPA
jgi:formate dehydrogenase major subunit